MTPHYPAALPLDAIISNVEAGHDEFITEKYAEEIENALRAWGESLRQTPPDARAMTGWLDPSFSAASFRPVDSKPFRPDGSLQVFRNRFSADLALDSNAFMREISESFGHLERFLVTEFDVASLRVIGTSPLSVQTLVRYDLLGSASNVHREGRVGYWEIEWRAGPSGEFRAAKWRPIEETLSRSTTPIFTDITVRALAGNASYTEQMLHSIDYWRTVIDAASGIDIYGNNGIAIGDIDNDDFEDFYVCQPAGIPNRLYRNRGDGTFEDVTESAGVGVLDGTPCALLADLDNRGVQDLLVVRSTGPLLFRNQGRGKFRLQPDAFRFAHAPEGTFTSAALADYDRDGLLDVYFCLYNYYGGLVEHRIPVPYYAAENGPPNFLFHNNGDGTFSDATAATGMSQNNHRFSFSCEWGDFNNDGWPDLYVANDFGKKNLYRNNGDGTFTDIAEEAGVLDVGPGMSVCWFDYDNDGRQDLYVANMWEAPGLRVTMQDNFMKDAPQEIRSHYRNHAMGNALFHNEGNGKFVDQSLSAGVGLGRWSWSCTSFDFDHDGYSDIYVPNGFLSEARDKDLESFFWRQVVAKSPQDARMTREYEQGWNAINELIRSDYTWGGYQRNILYLNNQDGTFSDVSGAVGLDFLEDCRAFALADFDHDGRLEIVLKSRNAPQIRILHNEMPDVGNIIAFHLKGKKSNRDGIGAAVIVETSRGTQTQFVQAGLGFSTQHTKELFFGVGKHSGPLRATIRWPSGTVQKLEQLAVNNRISIEEGKDGFLMEPFRPAGAISASRAVASPDTSLSSSFATWLLDPLVAPNFTLPDIYGVSHALRDFNGDRVIVNFWATWSPRCYDQLICFQTHYSQWAKEGLRLIAISVDRPEEVEKLRSFVHEKGLSFLILHADDHWSAVYNVLYRYLYDRRRDLGIPSSFLIDTEGRIVRVYQGPVDAATLLRDGGSIPSTTTELIRKGLPFPGEYYGSAFRRDYFSYGAAFFQRGLLDEAISSFEYALKNTPNYAPAYYNLGTLYLQEGKPEQAHKNFLRALEIRPHHPDTLNNLGLLAAREGHPEEAARYFQEAIRCKPDYTLALMNLGNLYRHLGRLEDAQEILEQGLRVKSDDPDLNYNLAMVYVQLNNLSRAKEYFQKALAIRPHFPEALNNLGVIYMMWGESRQAAAQFQECIRVTPAFDQPYLNLARLYLELHQKQKAQDTLRALLEQHPDHPQARKELEEISQ